MAILGLDNPNGILELLRISNNEYKGVSYIEKFGENPSVDSGSAEDIWDVGGPYIFLASAEAHHIIAGADDSATGFGARTLKIFGLNAAFEEIDETVTLTAAAIVTTTSNYLRIHRMEVLTAGTSAVNVNNITATAAVTSSVTAQINARVNQTLMAIYTIPENKIGFIFDYYGSTGRQGNISVDLTLETRKEGEVFHPENIFGLNAAGTSNHTHVFTIPLMVDEKTDIKISTIASGVAIEVFGGFDVLMRNKT